MASPCITSELGVNAPMSFRLLPGECVVVEGTDKAQLHALAHLCLGLVDLRSGNIRFLGHEWVALPHNFAAALRGRIGRSCA